MAATLSDADLLTKYGLTDPGTDVERFALQVHQLGPARRAVLHCKTESQAGWHLLVRYTIWGTDSEGQAINATTDSARVALATIIRELNRRYARRQRPA